ncbi:MAG: spermidine synthase, partial [Rubritalea sp.]
NHKMYSPAFLGKLKTILKPGGCVTYWLSEPAPKFKKLLGKAGFIVEEHAARPHRKAKRSRHCIYVARDKAKF